MWKVPCIVAGVVISLLSKLLKSTSVLGNIWMTVIDVYDLLRKLSFKVNVLQNTQIQIQLSLPILAVYKSVGLFRGWGAQGFPTRG